MDIINMPKEHKRYLIVHNNEIYEPLMKGLLVECVRLFAPS